MNKRMEIQRTIDLLLNSGGLNGRLDVSKLPPAPATEEAPEDGRRVNSTNWHIVCHCGVKWQSHYDGWDGNHLGCDEARRRQGMK